ncbi:MAG: exosortase U, partial [Isosphaeraceae bacterium]
MSTGSLRRSSGSWSGFLSGWPAWLTALAFLPLLGLHLKEVWSRPHYEFVPLLIPGAGLLIWRRGRNLGVLEPGDRTVALAHAVLVWSALALAILLVSSWLGAFAALVAIVAAAYAFGGARLSSAVFPAVALLAIALPPPFQLDYALVGRLQGLVSRLAGMFLDLLRIDHVMEGNVIDLGGRQLLVDQACSGVYSLFTLVAFTVFYVLWTRASWMRTAILLGSAVFWVIAGNVLRIVSIAVLASRFQIDATVGKKHTALGLAGFVLMLFMVVCTDRLATFGRSVARWIRHHAWGTQREVAKATWGDLLFRWDAVLERRDGQRVQRGLKWRRRLARRAAGETDLDDDETKPSRSSRVRESTGPTRLPDPRRTWPGTLAGGLAFGLLLIPQTRLPGLDWKTILSDRGVEARVFAGLGETSMPEKVDEFRRIGFHVETRDHDLIWGENSRAWAYAGPEGGVGVSLDYPFVGWHDLTECYTGRGYQVVSRKLIPKEQGGPAVVAELSRRDGRYARLVFGLFDREGRALTPPFSRDVVSVLRTRLASWGLGDAATAE